VCLLCRSGVRRETHRHTSRRCVIMCLFSCDTTPALLGAFFAAKIPSRISFFHTVHRLERFCVFCLCVVFVAGHHLSRGRGVRLRSSPGSGSG